jgi:hypothetical protein
MKAPANHRTPWRPEDWQHLANLAEQQVGVEYMAKKLGRTPGATAVALHRLRHGDTTAQTEARTATFTSYVDPPHRPSILTAREGRKTRRRARALFTLVLFGLRFTIHRKQRRHAGQ